MLNMFKTTAVAAVLATAPFAASAAVLMEGGDIFSIPSDGVEYFGDVDVNDIAGGTDGGQWMVQFNAETDPIDAEASMTIGRINLEQWSGLVMSWVGKDGSVTATLDSIDIAQGTNALGTTFTAPYLTQYLMVSWDAAVAGANFDIEVEVAAVPVPAAGLMLLTALGGAAALRRRAKS